MKLEDFEKAQQNIYYEHWLPEMREISQMCCWSYGIHT